MRLSTGATTEVSHRYLYASGDTVRVLLATAVPLIAVFAKGTLLLLGDLMNQTRVCKPREEMKEALTMVVVPASKVAKEDEVLVIDPIQRVAEVEREPLTSTLHSTFSSLLFPPCKKTAENLSHISNSVENIVCCNFTTIDTFHNSFESFRSSRMPFTLHDKIVS